MEGKIHIEEKRVKSTIIRRRSVAAVVPPPEEKKEVAAEVGGALPPAKKGEVLAEPRTEVSGTASRPGESPETGRPVGTPIPSEETVVKPKKVGRKKSADEIEMEMIERAGGLKKVAEIIEVMPERLERVYRPERSTKKRRILAKKEFKKTELTTPKAIKKLIRIENRITVGELSRRMGIKVGEVVKKLLDLGSMATITQTIDADTALLVAHDFGYDVENVAFEEQQVLKQEEVRANLRSRPPVVTVMGHVDHGKTTLLDTIRQTQVAEGEAGGITQHVGAYEVRLPKGKISFLDTPGHEAFTAIRARGAKVTDLVVLVVAADDGVMPQTVEAIHHARAAKVPIIVAINKIDKPGADPARAERGLMEQGIVSEKLGGDTILVPVSAKTGQGLEDLLEMILLQAEVLDLKADPTLRAEGVVIESKLDRGRGPVATLLVKQGTLRRGDSLVCGRTFGRVRAMFDFEGNPAEEAGPSTPVEILGLSGIPEAGDPFDVVPSEEMARDVIEHRESKRKEGREVARPRLEDLYAEAGQPTLPDLKVLIKADVHGSAEALRDSIGKLATDKIRVTVLHWGVGAITESDVMLALASKAIIIGFRVRADAKGRELAEQEKVEIRSYSIIYEVLEDLQKAMTGMLQPVEKEEYLGRAEIRQLFKISKIGQVAGCVVQDGKIVRTASIRVLRDSKVVFTGRLGSLKRFKDDVREVIAGQECGMTLESFQDLKPGDLLESYQIEKVAATL